MEKSRLLDNSIKDLIIEKKMQFEVNLIKIRRFKGPKQNRCWNLKTLLI